jgi:hypothetical protein
MSGAVNVAIGEKLESQIVWVENNFRKRVRNLIAAYEAATASGAQNSANARVAQGQAAGFGKPKPPAAPLARAQQPPQSSAPVTAQKPDAAIRPSAESSAANIAVNDATTRVVKNDPLTAPPASAVAADSLGRANIQPDRPPHIDVQNQLDGPALARPTASLPARQQFGQSKAADPLETSLREAQARLDAKRKEAQPIPAEAKSKEPAPIPSPAPQPVTGLRAERGDQELIDRLAPVFAELSRNGGDLVATVRAGVSQQTPRPSASAQQLLVAAQRAEPVDRARAGLSPAARAAEAELARLVKNEGLSDIIPHFEAQKRGELVEPFRELGFSSVSGYGESDPKPADETLKRLPPYQERSKMFDAGLAGWQAIRKRHDDFVAAFDQRMAALDADIGGMALAEWPAGERAHSALKTRLSATLEMLSGACKDFEASQKENVAISEGFRSQVGDYEVTIDKMRRFVLNYDFDDPEMAQVILDGEDRFKKRTAIDGARTAYLTKEAPMIGVKAAEATTYISMLDKALSDPDRAVVGDTLTLGEAIYLKRCGVRFKDCGFSNYNDQHFVSGEDSCGKGACNTVDKLVHDDGQERFFKPEMRTDRGNGIIKGHMGIDCEAPHYGNRNIGSRAISEALGLDVIPKARVAVHNNKFGLLMDAAPGGPPARIDAQANRWVPVKPWQGAPSPELLMSLHGQLNGLEWCDVLTGQMDRHQENYHVQIVDNTAKVTGIDNDRAFGSKQNGLANPKGNVVGTPKLIDRKIYDRLDRMNFDDDVLPRLRGLLTEDEMNAARQRFDAVLTRVKQLYPDYVVNDWMTWTAPDGKTASQYLDAQKQGSLFARDFAQFCPEACSPPAPPISPAKPSTAAKLES